MGKIHSDIPELRSDGIQNQGKVKRPESNATARAMRHHNTTNALPQGMAAE